MNTPLMELIEWAEKEASFITDDDSHLDRRWRSGLMYGIAKATELLEKDRDVIEKAYAAGLCQNSFSGVSTAAKKMASDYYTKTFTNESK